MMMEHPTATSLSSIPTISAAVANMPPASNGIPLSSSASSFTHGSGDDAVAARPPPPPSTLQIVQQKFKDNEKVHLIFEAYQKISLGDTNRLLAVVSSIPGGTYAIISLAILRTPIRLPNDLKIINVFAINENFQLKIVSMDEQQFDLITGGDDKPSTFNYYPLKSIEDSVDFQTFFAQIISFHHSMIDVGALPPDTVLSYSWLNDYRQVGEVKQELKKRESEYIVYKDIKVYCATYNVNNRPYCDIPLHLWLSCSEQPPDIYAIALQELDTSTKAITRNENQPNAQWIEKMLESVHPDSQYEELNSVRLVGMMLTILIRSKLRPHVSRCRLKSIARGVLKTFGNKGGVAVSLQLNESNICFVNSHLAAHMANVEDRNQDYAGIVNGLIFDDDLRRTINDHDQIFWIGDLNYRIQEPPGIVLPWPRDDINDYELLLQFDQLRQEMRKGKCFDNYTEGAIKFRPTYKYDTGTDNYDSSEKQRAPAYCDRILWKGARIEQLAYNSVMHIRHSDHKPVYAVFNVKIKTRDEKKYKRVQEEVLKAVDKRENDNQPQISVEKTVIDFGLIRFNEPAHADFTIWNNCPLHVNFRFKKKDPPLNAICERWLQVEPHQDNLMIDSARNIRLKLLADSRTITGLLKKIRTTNWKFDFDILILHVENGPDIFITVTGEYQPSCFGLSVETMCRTNRPISEYTQDEIKQLMNDETPYYRVTMPREFFLLIDYLHKQGSKLKGGIFVAQEQRSSALTRQFNAVRDWLDSWSDDEFPGNARVAGEALLLLLELPEQALLEPVVEDLLCTTTKAEAMDFIDMLSAPRRNVFMHLCMFLREGVECGYYDQHQVAEIFGRILLNRDDCSRRSDFVTRCKVFMLRFIGSDADSHHHNHANNQLLPMGGGSGGGCSTSLSSI